jgi:hypothetical protein
MKTAFLIFPRWKRLAWLGLVIALPAVTRATEGPRSPVGLPPMIVEEANLPPWLYATADGWEYLSRCSERTTRDYVEMRRQRMQWVRAIVPAEFLLQSDALSVSLLTSQKLKPGGNSSVVNQVVDYSRQGNGPDYSRASTAPNMMLNDTDAVGVYLYIDENVFKAENLTISSDNVRYLIERRTPTLPIWLREGIMAVYHDINFQEPAITLRPLLWDTPETSRRIARNPEAPRLLLTGGELFANPRTLPAQIGLARSQCALLLRWALDPRNGQREAFWRFASRACEEPVTEPLFQSCFGFGFSDLRDRLSDYLTFAVKEPLKLPTPPPPEGPEAKVRPATSTEIARLRGEWERLSVPFVRALFPAEAGRYLEQARRTLHRAYDDGDRDPRLLAILGLCEVDAGNDPAARPFLEAAVAYNVVRPRVYAELARLKWTELTAKNNPAQNFTEVEVSEVVALLRRGLKQAPVLADSFDLFAQVWSRSSLAPSPTELQLLKRNEILFVANPGQCMKIATALGRHGQNSAAISLLGTAFIYVRDEATRRQFAQLFASLERPR